MNREWTSRISREPGSADTAGRALVAAAFLSSLGFNFIFPLLPIYVIQLAGPGPTTAMWSGLTLAATPLAAMLAAPFWGSLADRFGHRPLLLRALASTAVVTGLMALPDAPWHLAFLRALAGVTGSFQTLAMGAMASWSRPEDLSRAVSRLQMAMVGGAIVGPLAGGTVAFFFGIRFAPLVGAVSLCLGMLLVARWFHAPGVRRARIRGPKAALRPIHLWLPMLTLAAVQFTDASFYPTLPLMLARGEEASTVAALSGLAASFSATAAAVGAGFAGRSFRWGVGYRNMVAALAGLAGLVLLCVFAPLPWGVIALRVICGGIAGTLVVAAFSAGGLAVPPAQRGSAYGWLVSSSLGGFAASPFTAGLLAGIDLRAVLVVDVVLCLGAAVSWGWSRGLAPAAPAAEPPRAPEASIIPATGQKPETVTTRETPTPS